MRASGVKMREVYEEKIKPRLKDIALWQEQKLSLRNMAKRLGVSAATLSRYLSKKSVKEQITDEQKVEQSLYKACTGYTTQVVKHYKVKKIEYDEVTGKKIREEEQLVQALDEVYVPANISAQKFYLVNRLPERWSSRPSAEEEAEGNKAGVIVIPEIVEIEACTTEQ